MSNNDLSKLDWLSIGQGAQHAQSTEYLVRAAIAKGDLTAYRFGGKTKIRRADLDRWMTPQPVQVTYREPIELDDLAR